MSVSDDNTGVCVAVVIDAEGKGACVPSGKQGAQTMTVEHWTRGSKCLRTIELQVRNIMCVGKHGLREFQMVAQATGAFRR